MIRIRKATPDDAEAMSGIVVASIRELCAADHRGDPVRIGSWTANKTPQNFRRWIAEAETQFFVAERHGCAAGVGGVSLDATIRLNYVAPEHRYQGVSRALLDHMEEVLAAAGVAVARLRSSETALSMYRGAGWVEDDAVDLPEGLEGRPMRKRLR